MAFDQGVIQEKAFVVRFRSVYLNTSNTLEMLASDDIHNLDSSVVNKELNNFLDYLPTSDKNIYKLTRYGLNARRKEWISHVLASHAQDSRLQALPEAERNRLIANCKSHSTLQAVVQQERTTATKEQR